MIVSPVIPAMFARYRHLGTGNAMVVVQQWGNDTGIFTVRLADAWGREWVGSVEDFYESWIHEDLYTHSRTQEAAS